MIVAHDINRVIGNSVTNSIPWKLTPDLVRFKKLTMGHTIIMGRKTVESLPRKLEGRKLIVISRTQFRDEVTYPSIITALQNIEGEVFLAGGAMIYEEGLQYATTLHRTVVDMIALGDVKFPEFTNEWLPFFRSQIIDYLGTKFYFETLKKGR